MRKPLDLERRPGETQAGISDWEVVRGADGHQSRGRLKL